MSIIVFLALVAIGLSGATTNYIIAYLKGHLGKCNFIAYLISEVSRTAGSLGGIIITALGMMQAGAVDLNNNVVFFTMFSAGFTIDNVVNKGPNK